MAEHIHLIGIGGTGISAIARLLMERGYQVSGSDRQMTLLAAALQSAGAQVFIGHDPAHLGDATLVIRSSAVPDDNPEVQAARRRGIQVLKRSDYIGRLMAGSKGIAVAGTHGKTTTTSMLVWILSDLGYDPSFIVGGVVTNLGTNARSGKGPHFVVEADEYDRMFLGLRPNLAVVTNVEHDHPDCFPTPEDFSQAFREFVARLVPDGILVACADDRGAAQLLPYATSLGREVYSYGLAEASHFRARNLTSRPGSGYEFDVFRKDEFLIRVGLHIPGRHNVQNALAAFSAGFLQGLPPSEIAHSLAAFRGASRRFDVRGEVRGVVVVDDYAHHPTEIRATIAAARDRYPGRPLWVVWQPHTFSRTRALFSDFVASFGLADHVLITGIYGARETAPGDLSGEDLVSAMSHPDARFIPVLQDVTSYLVDHLNKGDVLLTLSAGDAVQISTEVIASLASLASPMHSENVFCF